MSRELPVLVERNLVLGERRRLRRQSRASSSLDLHHGQERQHRLGVLAAAAAPGGRSGLVEHVRVHHNHSLGRLDRRVLRADLATVIGEQKSSLINSLTKCYCHCFMPVLYHAALPAMLNVRLKDS